MSRLDDVLERHQRRTKKSRERLAVILIVGGLFIAVIVLMIFTDLGKPPTAAPAGAPSAARPGQLDRDAGRGASHRLDGVLLAAPPKPAAAAR